MPITVHNIRLGLATNSSSSHSMILWESNEPKPTDERWIERVRLARQRVSIDTVLADQFHQQLLAAGVDRRLFHTQDGHFSMYWDLMTQRIGPSSYCEDVYMEPFDPIHVSLREAFSQLRTQPEPA